MPKHKLKGTIVSHKTDKTAVVLVEKVKAHPRYQKRVKISRKYQVDDPSNQYQEGEKVIIEECRPQSKRKHWRIIKKVHDSNSDEIENS